MSLVLPSQDDIDALSNGVVIVSEMNELLSSIIEETDVLTFAALKTSLSVNYNISKEDFDRHLLNHLLSSDLKINGKWEFGTKSKNGLSASTSRIINGPADTVINKEYFDKYVLKQIDDFKRYVYNEQHVPSVVGDIIFSTTLNTEAKVKAKYGGNNWKAISGNYMILGCGKCEDNDLTKYGNIVGTLNIDRPPSSGALRGGENEVKLVASEIPRHTHKFIGNSSSGTFSFEYKGASGAYLSKGVLRQKDYGEFYSFKKAVSGTLAGTIKIQGSVSLNSAKLYGGIELGSTVYNQSNEKPISFKGHNNIPPVLMVYAWRRTS